MKRKCDWCGKLYTADTRNTKRGWGLCCSKKCAASKRESGRIKHEDEMRMRMMERFPYSYDGANDDQWGDEEFGIHE
ncbi:MAG: hypothetical protein LBS88_04160 [Tannerellaceae bacterium]|jgi:hypothetical protein|nr:hypothetical protein [Tannerellaceae bacterium]